MLKHNFIEFYDFYKREAQLLTSGSGSSSTKIWVGYKNLNSGANGMRINTYSDPKHSAVGNIFSVDHKGRPFYHVSLVGGGDIVNIILIIRNNQQRRCGKFPCKYCGTVTVLLKKVTELNKKKHFFTVPCRSTWWDTCSCRA